MSVERCFLGWDDAVAPLVCRYLLPETVSGPVDMGASLIVVPTRQAGRRLRESLATRCEATGAGLLSVHVVPPSYFVITGDTEAAAVCPPALVQAIWAKVLREVEPAAYPAVFGAAGAARDSGWALRTGCDLQSLRAVLADGGLAIADVVTRLGDALPEPDRWAELARLESRYRAAVRAVGGADPCDAKIRRAERPVLPEGVTRVVVAAVPDPSLLTLRALARLADTVPVVVLVHAPDTLASCFDVWGRPIPEAWQERAIPVPGGHAAIQLAGTPQAQAACVVDAMTRLDARWGADDVAIGVPDVQVIPHLMTALAEVSLRAFDPGER